ncbi:MAG TPA: M1 family aminopeptidase, partial [Planctomycetota bacterium]|nr:M1 family aminopeptidase [Planctomycetota bacterium]
WIVTATGVLQNPEEVLTAKARERLAQVLASDEVVTIVGPDEVGPGNSTAQGDQLTWHFVADNVNDFAWATAANYVWKATRATIPEKGPIPIHMVHLPERENRFRNAGAITRHALEFYSALWAPYPFPQLTLQDGPSSGMEYPMVINSNQGAADHETGHQWWPMMVGNNETMYGWMDEGFNTYMNILSDAHRRGRAPNLDGHGQNYGQQSGDENEPPMMWNANYAGNGYGFQTYGKAPQMLSMLGGIVDDEAVQRAMSAYAKTWAFKHPSPWDFVFFMSNALGRDLGWFWYYWLWIIESVDGSIESVRASGSGTVVTVRQHGQMPSPVVLKVEFAPEGPAPAAMANAVMQQDGSAIVTWPVEVWFTGNRAFEARLEFGARAIAKITLDPAGRFPDRSKSDNVWPRG